MKNYIGLNIKHLCDKNLLKQDDFGLLFDLNKGVVGTYVREISNPKIEIIQKICAYYKISIDDFVNKDLSSIKENNPRSSNGVKDFVEPYIISPKYVELLEKSLEDKDKIIRSLEEQLGLEQPKGSSAS